MSKVVIGIGLVGIALSLLLGSFIWQWIGTGISVSVVIVGAAMEEQSIERTKERRN